MKQYQYNTIFKKICIPEILKEAENTSIVWHGKELRWDVKHELLAYAEYDNTYNVNELLELSNNRYKLLDKIWEKKDSIEDFYIKSKKVLPWGHGVFLANHELAEREKSFIHRVYIIEKLIALGAKSVLDYGGGGGHTSLLAKALGMDVTHYEYNIFNPYVKWRADKIDNDNLFVTVGIEENALEHIQVDSVICTDVAEHVSEPNIMLSKIHSVLNEDGLLYFSSSFVNSIPCHLHHELNGQEEMILRQNGFKSIGKIIETENNFYGLFKKFKL